MLLITVTNWKHKAGVVIRLLLFLLLIWMITPQFFNFISGHIASFKDHLLQSQHPEIGSSSRSSKNRVRGRAIGL